MFEQIEFECDPQIVLKIPLLEGQNFQNLHHENNLIQARVERPLLPKDVLELRSSQARTLDASGHIFDENNRLIGKRIFVSDLSGIPEDEVFIGDEARSFLSVGAATPIDLASSSGSRPLIRVENSSFVEIPGSESGQTPRPSVTSNQSYVVLTAAESGRYLEWANLVDEPGEAINDWRMIGSYSHRVTHLVYFWRYLFPKNFYFTLFLGNNTILFCGRWN